MIEKKILYSFFIVLMFNIVLSKSVKYDKNIKLFGWNVLIGDKYFNIYGECNGLFVSPQVFISDADCFAEMLKSGDFNKIYLANKGAKDVLYKIEKENIYYNENLGKIYNDKYRQIVTLISENSITEDYISLNTNLEEIDTSKCYTSDGNSLLHLNPCLTMEFSNITNNYVHAPAFLCSWFEYDLIESTVVFCEKKNSQKLFFLGLLSAHRDVDDYGEWIGVENVVDLQEKIGKKLKKMKSQNFL